MHVLHAYKYVHQPRLHYRYAHNKIGHTQFVRWKRRKIDKIAHSSPRLAIASKQPCRSQSSIDMMSLHMQTQWLYILSPAPLSSWAAEFSERSPSSMEISISLITNKQPFITPSQFSGYLRQIRFCNIRVMPAPAPTWGTGRRRRQEFLGDSRGSLGAVTGPAGASPRRAGRRRFCERVLPCLRRRHGPADVSHGRHAWLLLPGIIRTSALPATVIAPVEPRARAPLQGVRLRGKQGGL